jgi:signal recognition particle subunit SRP54
MLSRLKDVLDNFVKRGPADKEQIEALVKEIQRVLIQSDVDVKLVFELSKRIKERALKEELPAGITRKEHVIKVVYEELVNVLGAKKADIKLDKQKILLLGLYGSGKTTTAIKLAYFFKKRGLKVCVVGCDVHRAAAFEQLKQLGEKYGIEVFGNADEKNSAKILEKALPGLKNFDVIIVDSAGRSALDEELMQEIKSVVDILKPDEKWLVLSADIGQAAGTQAKAFSEAVGITGVIVTKMDSSAKGGGAISACYASGAGVKFIGTGEKADDLEVYDPVRFVSRILGMGDLETLLEKVREAFREEDAKKILEGEFTLVDFYNQIENVKKMGSLSKILEMLPLPGIKIPKEMIEVQEEKFQKWKYIIDSMTIEERNNPDIINRSRIERIAKGSGTKPEEVKELLKAYRQMKTMIKKFRKGRFMKRGMIRSLGTNLPF